jgi:hypothetical protein
MLVAAWFSITMQCCVSDLEFESGSERSCINGPQKRKYHVFEIECSDKLDHIVHTDWLLPMFLTYIPS